MFFFSLAFIFNSWSLDAQIDFNLCQKCDPLSALWKQALKITLIYQEDTGRFLLAFLNPSTSAAIYSEQSYSARCYMNNK